MQINEIIIKNGSHRLQIDVSLSIIKWQFSGTKSATRISSFGIYILGCILYSLKTHTNIQFKWISSDPGSIFYMLWILSSKVTTFYIQYT